MIAVPLSVGIGSLVALAVHDDLSNHLATGYSVTEHLDHTMFAAPVHLHP